MEKDITILKSLIEDLKREEKLIGYDAEIGIQALENIMKRYRELEEKNTDILERLVTERMVTKVMSENIKGYQEALENSIPKSKVKEKIEELKELIIETQKELGSASKEFTIYVYQEKILQELMEDK